MLPEFFIYASVITDVIIFLFITYYYFRVRSREKRIEKVENALDIKYHHVVDSTLSRERKILDDASTEASQIITGAQYITHSSKEDVDDAIKAIVQDISHEGQSIAHTFATEYAASLQKMSTDSLTQFHTIMANLQMDLQKQIKEFHDTLLPNVEKELESYKQERIKQIDQVVLGIVQKASQDIFNKSISLADHQQLVIQSLEKAKKEGIFD